MNEFYPIVRDGYKEYGGYLNGRPFYPDQFGIVKDKVDLVREIKHAR